MFTDVVPERMEAYTANMAKGMEEKLFFLPHVPPGAALLDFGCADARLLDAVAQQRPDLALAGLDISPAALAQARARGTRACLCASQDEGTVWAKAHAKARPVFLLASSVLHEVAHYGGREAWESFWSFAEKGPFSGIAVRDFSTARDDAAAPGGAFARAVRAGLPGWQRASFESMWGTITTQGQAVHAALKAPWTESWGREGPENYMAVGREALEARLCRRFTPSLWIPHIHPWTDARTRQQFGLGMPCPTHLSTFAWRELP